MKQLLNKDEGNAILGFAVAAPVSLLLLIGVIQLSGILWQREVASEILRQEVYRDTRSISGFDTMHENLDERLSDVELKLLDTQAMRATYGSGQQMKTVTMKVLHPSLGWLPPLTLQYRVTMVNDQ